MSLLGWNIRNNPVFLDGDSIGKLISCSFCLSLAAATKIFFKNFSFFSSVVVLLVTLVRCFCVEGVGTHLGRSINCGSVRRAIKEGTGPHWHSREGSSDGGLPAKAFPASKYLGGSESVDLMGPKHSMRRNFPGWFWRVALEKTLSLCPGASEVASVCCFHR